ncbi:hypothetical protein LH87_18435 [Citrobacter braakii]|nr:hypothetical protein LH87_18435 [Citrobacter braakii]
MKAIISAATNSFADVVYFMFISLKVKRLKLFLEEPQKIQISILHRRYNRLYVLGGKDRWR